jgi:hypothetical protein
MRWIAVVVAAACGGGRSEPPPAGSAAPVVVRVDARVAAVAIDAAIDAGFATVPDFGCFAWSPQRELGACIVGSRGNGIGESRVRLVFVPLRDGVEAPPEVVILESESKGPNELPADVAVRLAEAVRGFVPLAPAGQIASGRGFRFDPAIDVGGVRLAVTATSAPRIAVAPCHHTTLIATFGHGGSRVLAERTDAISELTVRAFVVGGAVLVDHVMYTGDEGVYGGYGDVWRCNRETCRDVE